MKIHCIMHVPFEGPGKILDWVEEKGHSLEYTRFWQGDTLPDPEKISMLVIMGGPMNVFDYHMHSWMEDEIAWVQDFISSGKPVMGIRTASHAFDARKPIPREGVPVTRPLRNAGK